MIVDSATRDRRPPTQGVIVDSRPSLIVDSCKRFVVLFEKFAVYITIAHSRAKCCIAGTVAPDECLHRSVSRKRPALGFLYSDEGRRGLTLLIFDYA